MRGICKLKFAVFVLFALSVSAKSAAQMAGDTERTENESQHEFKFRTLSPQGGLSYNGVNDIEKDSDGFVWVMLESDLIRFDGYEYKRYYSTFQNIGDTSRLLFHDIEVDREGRLHVSCIQGLFRYDLKTDSFEKLLDGTYFVFFDARDNIWVRRGSRFGMIGDDGGFDEQLSEGRSITEVRTAVTCEDGTFLVGTSDGQILRYDYTAGTFRPFYLFPEEYGIVKMQLSGDRLWVLLTDQGLAAIDIPSQKLETIHDFPLQYEGRTILLRGLLVDKNNHIWIGTQQGIWFFDPDTTERRMYRHSHTDIFSIPNNSIRAVTDDPEGNIWIGTFSGGVCMVDPDETKSFTTYTQQRSGLSHSMVSAFAEDSGALWIGTEGGGVNRLDKRTGEFSWLQPKVPDTGSSPPVNHIKSLVRDRRGRLWIATFLSGLISYDINTGRFRYFGDTGPAGERLLARDLRKMVPEGDRGIWIAYQSFMHAVSFMPFDGEPIRHVRFDSEGEQWYIWDMCRSGRYLWMISQRSLYRMDVMTEEVADVSSESFPFLNARSVCADGEGNIWTGTNDGLIIRRDAVTGEFATITGLADYNASTVYSLCSDSNGDLWMGTDNGLFRYAPGTGRWSRFDANDGAQGRMYYPQAAMVASSGRLLFGGTDGFSIVDPLAVTTVSRRPKTIIPEFTVNNTPVVPRFGEESPGTFYGSEIVLTHREASFGFKLASDNYTTLSGSRYRYRLAGYDPAPMTVYADNRTVDYSNVPAGTYMLEVSASADGETWGEPVSLKIVRLPAPWNSRAAWVLYFMILLTVAGTIIYYYTERRRLAMQLYLDGLDKEKKEEIHRSQLRFFTNISHDFRTPLSLINGTVDNLRKEGLSDYYYKILHGNAQRLLNLVNELMDFRTVENGMMRLQVKPSEINRLVTDISADFRDLAREKNIDFRIECDESLSAPVPVDPAVVEKIVMNLLNNAFKYTPREGAVTISTHAPGGDFRSRFDTSFRIPAEYGHSRSFTIAVSDTGVGISKESISKVFERFYKVNTANADSHLGTGIGLALVKSLVLLHRGVITIFSERDRGTDMVVELPFDDSVYGSQEHPGTEERSYESNVTGDRFDTSLSAAESMLMRTRKMILVVEDNDDLRILLSNFLSSEYEVVQAADGLAAAEWLEENEADLIISDIMMPRKDGVALLREVRENIATSHIPFILLTAKTDISSKLEGTGSGADLYFEKPVDLNLLMLSVGNIFNHQNRLREYYSRNYFVESSELSQNEHDNAFLKKLIDTIDRNLAEPVIDVHIIASELSMSRSKLYSKVKMLTGKSIVEFILNYRLRKAARLIIEQDMSIRQVMDNVGIRSQSYFTRAFKEEFGETPSVFAKQHKKRALPDL